MLIFGREDMVQLAQNEMQQPALYAEDTNTILLYPSLSANHLDFPINDADSYGNLKSTYVSNMVALNTVYSENLSLLEELSDPGWEGYKLFTIEPGSNVSSYVNATFTDNFKSTNSTIEFLAYINNTTTLNHIFTITGSKKIDIVLESNQFRIVIDDTNITRLDSFTNLYEGFYHFALVYNNTPKTASFYINGIKFKDFDFNPSISRVTLYNRYAPNEGVNQFVNFRVSDIIRYSTNFDQSITYKPFSIIRDLEQSNPDRLSSEELNAQYMLFVRDDERKPLLPITLEFWAKIVSVNLVGLNNIVLEMKEFNKSRPTTTMKEYIAENDIHTLLLYPIINADDPSTELDQYAFSKELGKHFITELDREDLNNSQFRTNTTNINTSITNWIDYPSIGCKDSQTITGRPNIAFRQYDMYLNTFTVEAWSYINQSSAMRYDVQVYLTGMYYENSMIELYKSTDGYFTFAIIESGNIHSTPRTMVKTNTKVPMNTWFHWAFTHNGSTNDLVLYLNNEKVYTKANVNINADNKVGSELSIGAQCEFIDTTNNLSTELYQTQYRLSDNIRYTTDTIDTNLIDSPHTITYTDINTSLLAGNIKNDKMKVALYPLNEEDSLPDSVERPYIKKQVLDVWHHFAVTYNPFNHEVKAFFDGNSWFTKQNDPDFSPEYINLIKVYCHIFNNYYGDYIAYIANLRISKGIRYDGPFPPPDEPLDQFEIHEDDTGNEPPSDTGDDTGNEPPSDTGDDTGNEPPSDTGDDTGGDTGDDTGGDTGDDTGGDTGDDTGGDTGDDTGGDTGDDTGGDTGDDTGGDTGDDTGGDTGDDTGDDTGGDTGDDTGGDTGDDTGGDTGDDTGGDTGDDTGGDTGGDTGDDIPVMILVVILAEIPVMILVAIPVGRQLMIQEHQMTQQLTIPLQMILQVVVEMMQYQELMNLNRIYKAEV